MNILQKKKSWVKFIVSAAVFLAGAAASAPVLAKSGEPVLTGTETEASNRQLMADYEDYQQRMNGIQYQWQIEGSGFEIIEDQIFWIETECFGAVLFVPAMDPEYNRLVIFFTREDGTVVYRTDQLEADNWYEGSLEQPVRKLSAVAFPDLNRDGRIDIVLIADCRNRTGAYASKDYKVGDVLFQGEDCFYRDYRISDKINRFGMNKSADCIIAYVRDGYSTEFLYTASTREELIRNGFEVIEELDYSRQFEKLGYLEVLPGSYTAGEFSTFMVYLVNEQGDIVWSFQPMGDFENLYSLKGITCRDIDGDGMKDILVLARYSYAGSRNELITECDYSIYYQRTDGFETDTEVKSKVRCSDADTASELVDRARAYWGWSPKT